MLGKLLKYEFRSTWKVQVLLIGILLAAAVLAGLSFLLPIWDTGWIGLPFSAILLVLLFYFAIIAASIGSTIYLAVRFYKSMYTDEGYLTNTLPVTARELLLAKTISMSLWRLVLTLATLGSIFLFITMMLIGGNGGTNILWEVGEQLHVLQDAFGMSGAFIRIALLLTVVSAFSSSIVMIVSFAIGQLAKSHRILGAIGAYFGINAALSFVSTICTLPVMFRLMADGSLNRMNIFSIYRLIFVSLIVAELVIGIALYFVSEYLVGKKLDLE